MSDPKLPPNIKGNATWFHDGHVYHRLDGVEPLWSVGYYDGIRSFACLYNGDLYHAIAYTWYRDTPFWLYRFKRPYKARIRHWMFLHYYAPQRWRWLDIMLFKLSYKLKDEIDEKAIGFWSLPKGLRQPLRDGKFDPVFLRMTNDINEST